MQDVQNLDKTYFTPLTYQKLIKLKNKLLKNPIPINKLEKLTFEIFEYYQHSYKAKFQTVTDEEEDKICEYVLTNFYKINKDSTIFVEFLNKSQVNKIIINNVTLYVLVDTNDVNTFNHHDIVKRIHILNHLYGQFKVTLYLALCNQPRIIYNITKDNSQCNFECQVNKSNSEYSGMTVGGFTVQGSDEIFIFKKEEVTKLLIHEIAHLINLDSYPKTLIIQNPWKNDREDLYIYEGYAEFVSSILNTIFLACEYVIDHQLNKSELINFLTTFMNIEFTYSYYLSAKLLKWYNTNINDFFHNKGAVHREPIFISEYVYLRTLIWQEFNLIDDEMQLLNNKFNTNNMNNNYSKLRTLAQDENALNKFILNIKLFNFKDDVESISYAAMEKKNKQ
jgi:hypothetical protein